MRICEDGWEGICLADQLPRGHYLTAWLIHHLSTTHLASIPLLPATSSAPPPPCPVLFMTHAFHTDDGVSVPSDTGAAG
eukprot:350941-Chlamydomonas_euryale.AAC.12